MMFLGLDIENGGPRLIDGVASSLLAHKGHDRSFIHQTKFSLRPVLLGIGMIDNGGIHEHPAIRKNPVEISGQGAEIPEGIFSLVLGDPSLNLFSKRVAV